MFSKMKVAFVTLLFSQLVVVGAWAKGGVPGEELSASNNKPSTAGERPSAFPGASYSHAEEACVKRVEESDECKDKSRLQSCLRSLAYCKTMEVSTKACDDVVKKYSDSLAKTTNYCPNGGAGTGSIAECARELSKCSAELSQLNGPMDPRASEECRKVALASNKDDLQKARDKFEKELETSTKDLNDLKEKTLKAQTDRAKAMENLTKEEQKEKRAYRESQNKLFDLRERNDQRDEKFRAQVQKFDDDMAKLESDRRKIDMQALEIHGKTAAEIAKINGDCSTKARGDAATYEASRQKDLTDSSSGVRVDGGVGALSLLGGARGTKRERVKRKERYFRALCIYDSQNQVKALEENKNTMIQALENQKKDFDVQLKLLKSRLNDMSKTLDAQAASDHKRTMYNFVEEANDYVVSMDLVAKARITGVQQQQNEDAFFNQQSIQLSAKLQQAEQNLKMIPELTNVDKELAKKFDKSMDGLADLRGVFQGSYSQCCTGKKAKSDPNFEAFCNEASRVGNDMNIKLPKARLPAPDNTPRQPAPR
jgi:hypothetical protein